MRNFLFHGYHLIDNDILWKTATTSVRDVIPLLETLIAAET